MPGITGASTTTTLSDAIDIVDHLQEPGSVITGTTSTDTTLSDAIDILASLNDATFLLIDPAEEDTTPT